MGKTKGHNPFCDPVVNVMVSAEEPESLMGRSGCASAGNDSSKQRLQSVIIQNGKDVLLHAPKSTECFKCDII